jgi:3-phosphoshikimate 1-carboxyvinyltransferase
VNKSITLFAGARLNGRIQHLPASKSISNRVLVLNALAGGGSHINNLSEANDTIVLQRLLQSDDYLLDAEDAGTTMRFLTAFFAIQGASRKLTGTERMQQRPIGLLAEALRQLGASVAYTGKEGFPPVVVGGFKEQLSDRLVIRGDVSSQFISALMMIGPVLPRGITLVIEGELYSRPYVEMTAALMQKFGGTVHVDPNQIYIPPGQYRPITYTVENDWSAASYWFAFMALAHRESTLILPSMTLRSLQGDRVIVDLMEPLGVMCQPRGNDLLLLQQEPQNEVQYDFRNCPDLAQTIMVVCAARGIKGIFTGLESLRIKETDRIESMRTELKKLGADLIEQNGTWVLTPPDTLPEVIAPLSTYKDHRMAMAFAPLAAMRTITIENPEVVRKSYPRFWEDVRQVGIRISGM